MKSASTGLEERKRRLHEIVSGLTGILADSPEDAARQAEHRVDWLQAVAHGEAGSAEAIEAFLVDRLNESGARMEGQSRVVSPDSL